jgi:hypothetical protein
LKTATSLSVAGSRDLLGFIGVKGRSEGRRDVELFGLLVLCNKSEKGYQILKKERK